MLKLSKNGRVAGAFLFDLAPATIVLIFSAAAFQLCLAQTPAPDEDDDRKNPPIPVGQTNKDLMLPSYNSNRELANVFHAREAIGITPKRAHCFEVKVDLYEIVKGTNSITTVVTTPEADVILGDRIMRTTNSVRVEREELIATATNADFNLETKKYVMRANVQILLKHFDIGKAASTSNTNSAPTTPETPPPTPAPIPPELQQMISHDPGATALPQ